MCVCLGSTGGSRVGLNSVKMISSMAGYDGWSRGRNVFYLLGSSDWEIVDKHQMKRRGKRVVCNEKGNEIKDSNKNLYKQVVWIEIKHSKMTTFYLAWLCWNLNDHFWQNHQKQKLHLGSSFHSQSLPVAAGLVPPFLNCSTPANTLTLGGVFVLFLWKFSTEYW